MPDEALDLVILSAVKADGTPDIANILFTFPVPYQTMSISQAAKIDGVKIPGRSGKQKQGVGYEDTPISISIRLVDIEDLAGNVINSADNQLRTLQAAFRDRSAPVGTSSSLPDEAPRNVPTVFAIQSRTTDLAGINTVLFSGLTFTDVVGETSLDVSLNFTEFEPTTRPSEKRKTKSAAALGQYMADMAYYDSLEAADAETGPVQDPTTTPAAVAAAVAEDAAAEAAHNEEAGEESTFMRQFRLGKEAAAKGGLGGLRL